MLGGDVLAGHFFCKGMCDELFHVKQSFDILMGMGQSRLYCYQSKSLVDTPAFYALCAHAKYEAASIAVVCKHNTEASALKQVLKGSLDGQALPQVMTMSACLDAWFSPTFSSAAPI